MIGIDFGYTKPSYGLSARIIEDRSLVETIEDWSRVRSPSRAARRRRRGFPQNIAYRQIPMKEVYSLDGGRTLVMHPETARASERQIAARMDSLTEDMIMGRVGDVGTSLGG